MGWTDEVLAVIADYIADGGVGTWKPTGRYQPSDSDPILLELVPQTPDRVIVLTAYAVSSDAMLNDTVLGVQVRTRGTADPRTVRDLADRVYDRLHGAQDLTDGDEIRLLLITHQSGSPLGADGNSRHERTDNYYVTTNRPSTHRPD